MHDNPEVKCPVCGDIMHRVPQAFTWYNNPYEVLSDQLDNQYRNWKDKELKKRKKEKKRR
jgi:hypothetical protein